MHNIYSKICQQSVNYNQQDNWHSDFVKLWMFMSQLKKKLSEYPKKQIIENFMNIWCFKHIKNAVRIYPKKPILELSWTCCLESNFRGVSQQRNVLGYPVKDWRCELTPYSERAHLNISLWGITVRSQWANRVKPTHSDHSKLSNHDKGGQCTLA